MVEGASGNVLRRLNIWAVNSIDRRHEGSQKSAMLYADTTPVWVASKTLSKIIATRKTSALLPMS